MPTTLDATEYLQQAGVAFFPVKHPTQAALQRPVLK